MNEIYLIINEKYFFGILEFVDKNNHIFINNSRYIFEIISKNKLKLINGNTKHYLYTYDSFLYFDNIFMRHFIYKINLIYNECFDNIILNFKNNEIIRINNRNNGIFKLENNKLSIKWNNNNHNNHNNHNNYEYFIKNDEITFIHEKYNKIIDNNILNYKYIKNNKIVIFIHVCYSEQGIVIMNEQIECIIKSEIFKYLDTIYLCIVGLNKKIEIIYPKVKIYYFDPNQYLYELRTINEIYNYSINNDETYILYIHTKGVRNAGNSDVIKSWRNMMEYFLIEKGLKCIEGLHYFDVIGNNIINQKCDDFKNVYVNKNHCYHFSGNFWWSKSSYIQKLNKLDLINFDEKHSYRYKAENWILSYENNIDIALLNQDYTNLHPYHRFIFDTYKNQKIFLKKITLNGYADM